jgi:NADH-quinone oxidoreductase subunit M
MEGATMTPFPWLTILTAVPLIGALVVLMLGGRNKALVRWTALSFAAISLILTLVLWHSFNRAADGFQFQELHAWIPSLNVSYRVGIDGLGLLMLLLTSIVVPIGMLASWQIEERVPLYFSLVLVLQTCLFGTFTALNFFHWFIFWELALIPAFFLVRLWGGSGSAKAAMQFLVYTMVGSVAMLLSFLAIFLTTKTFDFSELATLAQNGTLMPAAGTC